MSNTWEVIHGDCLEVMRGMESGSVDAVVTDPPYGISIGGSGRIGGSGVVEPTQYEPVTWDDIGLTREQWAEIRRVSREQVVFGFNHLAAVLGPCSGVLVWDKKCKNGWRDKFSDCEMAWTSGGGPARLFRHLWMGALRKVEGDEHTRVHPTQKPAAMMRWVLDTMEIPEGATVLDPFCGSGTTGVACVQTGRRFIGIEIDEKYAAIARRRIAEADAAQLFKPKVERHEAPSLLPTN